MKERISGLENKVEEMNSPAKEDVKSFFFLNPGRKYPGSMGHYENTKPIKGGRRRNPRQRHRKKIF